MRYIFGSSVPEFPPYNFADHTSTQLTYFNIYGHFYIETVLLDASYQPVNGSFAALWTGMLTF